MKLSLALLLLCVSAQAAVYYVSPTGNDTTGNGSQGTPWATIQKAHDMMVSGDAVQVSTGTYHERVAVRTSGESGNPIVYTNAGSAVVNGGWDIQADYVTVHGFEVMRTNYVQSSPSFSAGIYVEGEHVRLVSNYVHDAAWTAIYLNGSTSSTDTRWCDVIGNTCRSNQYYGIHVAGNSNNIIANEISISLQYGPFVTNGAGVYPSSPTDGIVSWLDADGIRFWGTNNLFASNYIHSIDYGVADGINPAVSDYNDSPHIDAFQTWYDASLPIAHGCIFDANRIVLTNWQSDGTVKIQNGWMMTGDNPSGYGAAYDLQIRNNVVYAPKGITASQLLELQVYNNVICGVTNVPGAEEPVGLVLTGTNCEIKNNIFVDQSRNNIYLNYDTSDTLTSRSNFVFRTSGAAAATSVTYPESFRNQDYWDQDVLFVDFGAQNFRLQSSSSAIGKGEVLNAVFTTDALNVTRGSVWDVGAYEYTDQQSSAIRVNRINVGTIRMR